MKRILTLSLVLITGIEISAQYRNKPVIITVDNWTDSTSFFMGKEPLLQGFGPYSDTLQVIYHRIFFDAGDEYVAINSAADYYLWFVKRYDQLFENAALYSHYYIQGDSKSMMTYLLYNYTGAKYPLEFHLEAKNLNQDFYDRADFEIESIRKRMDQVTNWRSRMRNSVPSNRGG